MFITTIVACIIGGMLYFYAAFAITKKIFKKRPLSYVLSGAAVFVIFCIMIFQKDFNKIGVIICMMIDALVTLAFYIGEKRALASGKHCGDFERDRGARKFAPYSLKKLLKKHPYPFLKDKGILNNLEYEPANRYVNTNSSEYKQEVMERKMTGHILHWLLIYMWYALFAGAWIWYFMGYGVYWMFIAAIDTFKELFTKQGSPFSFRAAISEIANSEELANGISTARNAVQSAASGAGAAISEVSRKASSTLSERRRERQDTRENDNNVIITSSDSTNNDIASDSENFIPDDSTQSTLPPQEGTINENNIEEIPDIENTYVSETSPDETTESTGVNIPISETSYEEAKFPDTVRNHEPNNTIPSNTEINATHSTEQRITSPYNPENTQPKKSKTIPVLITVIAVLIVILGVLGCMFFMMKRNEKNDTSDISSSIDESSAVAEIADTTEITEAAEITEAPTESETEAGTTAAATETETEAATEIPETDLKSLTIYPESDLSNYPQYIKAAENDRDLSLANYFFLVDINADNIPEFFLTDKDGRIYGVYTSVDNNFAELLHVGGTGRDWISLYNDGFISHGSSMGADGGYADFEYTGGTELTMSKSYSLQEYDGIPDSHGGEADISVSSLDNFINTLTESNNNYTTYDTSAAPSDFQFNANQFGYGGTVITQDDPLNLRVAPSSDAEVIIKMPKGSYVGIFGSNNDWYYVSYTENGITYYGYASTQFIEASSI